MIDVVELQERDVFSTGEAVIRAWSNGAVEGIPVLICNGLGAGPQCWPGLFDDPDCGFHVIGFHHRGTSGSGRPYFDGHTYIEDHAADALEVLRAFEIDQALVVGWSVGVSIAYELASKQPDRVAGLLSVCGLPDTSVGSIGHPLGIPSSVGQSVTSGALSALQALPAPILELVNQIPVNPATVTLLRYSGFLSARADSDVVESALTYYLAHDPQWYLTLARSAAEHQSPDLSDVVCPAEFVAARNDPFLSPGLIASQVEDLPNTTLRVVDGGHFLPLEQPAVIKRSLADLAERTTLSDDR